MTKEKENPFAKAIASRYQVESSNPTPSETVEAGASSQPPSTTLANETVAPKKRGRPATGKRSDDAWLGRTYYIKRETDLDVEDRLLQLKRSGIEIDKSELVNFLLAAWVKFQNGENPNLHISEITPR
jgi:hypothetical protein